MNDRTYYSREAAERARRARVQLASVAFLLGAGVGAGIALLMAPETGADARDTLANATEEQLNAAKRHANSVADKAKSAIS